ncbi:TetR/AcrR family transcriptional regulator [Nocardiopsis sp. MG754419]|uniref:TetR/AcrR family transcriptional regulator n=1 Tax=Nocardiopsis sp. MG754419 TaxID=2259865 RepID=UPI001BA5879C|nr:TetR/AcrR family transcriptional regulator [Nocardiopsis sp. MG754419]MBR8740214.1 TetR family transcriptional regulator [Nocardiopsis sp. MG754419]
MHTTERRPLTPAARRVLNVASELFYSRGINTVGMELVAEEAGVTKKTIYDRFGSKQRLVVAYLRARDEHWRDFLTSRLEPHPSPEAGIVATFDALAEWMDRENERGCAMVNAYAELSDPEHPGRAVAEEQKHWLRGLYRDLVRSAGASDAEALADTLTMLHEGAVVARNVTGITEAAHTAGTAARALLRLHGVHGSDEGPSSARRDRGSAPGGGSTQTGPA